MKKFLLIFLLSAFPVFVHAQTATVGLSSDVDGNLVVSITSDRDVSKGYKYLPLVSTNPISNSDVASVGDGLNLASTIPTKEALFNKNPLDIKVLGTKKNVKYHVRVVEIPPRSIEVRRFINADQTFTIKGTDIKIPELTFSRDGNVYTISGSVDTSDFSPSELNVSAQILKTDGGLFFSFEEIDLKSDGTYSFSVTSDSFSELKYQVVVRARSDFGDIGSRTIEVDAKKGTVIPTDTAGIAAYEKNRSYTLLAPLPGISKILDNDLCQEAQKTNPNEICDINQFINFVLKFMIGLAAVILVVRLILDGYNYMTTDIPFVQAKAKTGFRDAFIGLLVALSSYLILNTINPRLVKNEFSIDSVTFNVEEDENNIIKDDRFIPNTTTRTNRSCKGKIIDVKTGAGSFIDVCEEIAPKITQLFLDAKKENIVLSGGGYRTLQEQQDLYNENCEGGRKKCNPATARPGTSMHETGKAFDLKCDNKLITFSTPYKGVRTGETKKCFDWLSKNAQRYGLVNLKKENWHWSVNGR